MKTKVEIINNWLPRYTGVAIDQFSEYILLTNFGQYLEVFKKLYGGEILGQDKAMPSIHGQGVSFINFGIGSVH